MTLLSLLAAVAVTAGPSDATRNETAVERLHRKGVYCMDELERPKCAIRNFEAALDERTTQRELVTDSLLRLVKLQRKAGDDEAVRDLLRRFWDIGMKRKQAGHVPFSMRFFPTELDVMFALDVQRVAASPLLLRGGGDLANYVFTCDDELRNNIKMTRRWERAKQRAALTGREPYEIIYDDMDAKRKRREARARAAKNGKQRRRRGEPPGGLEPIFSSTTCKVAAALGDDNLGGWTKVAGAMNHDDFARSMAVLEVPNLAVRLSAAAKAGRIRAKGVGHWVLPGVKYAKQAVHLAKLDRNELVVGRADMIAAVIAAKGKRRRRMNRDVDRLLTEVPKDSAFFVVLSKAALEGLSFGEMKRSSAGFLKALLPKPKGLQIAVTVHDYVGVFTRVPTDNPVKGKMLISIAQMMMEGRAQKDPEAEKWLRNLDLAQASDKRALLMTYVMSQKQVEDIVWD